MSSNGKFDRHEDEKLIHELARWDDHAAAVARTKEITSRRVELTGCGLNLTGAHLTGLDLREFDLRHCTLNRADLHSTNLSGANLKGASLVCPGMERTNLTNAKTTPITATGQSGRPGKRLSPGPQASIVFCPRSHVEAVSTSGCYLLSTYPQIELTWR